MTIIIKSNQVATKHLGNIYGVTDTGYVLFADFGLNEYHTKIGGQINPVTLSELLQFSRSSKASYLDATNVIREVAANTPRIHFDPVSEKKGLLIEDKHTQLLSNIYAPATQTIAITHDTTKRLVLSVKGSGSATISGSAEVEVNSPASATENNPVVYKSTVTGNITITVTGSLSAFSLHWADTEGISPKMFTPVGTVEVTEESCEINRTLLAQVMGGATEFTVVMKVVETNRTKDISFAQKSFYLATGDTSEARKGIYINKTMGASTVLKYSLITDEGAVAAILKPADINKLDQTIVVSHKPNATKIKVNSDEIYAPTEPYSTVLDILLLGTNKRWSKLGTLNGIITSVIVYPYAMTAEQINSLTL